jgi:hypothetical protein
MMDCPACELQQEKNFTLPFPPLFVGGLLDHRRHELLRT